MNDNDPVDLIIETVVMLLLMASASVAIYAPFQWLGGQL